MRNSDAGLAAAGILKAPEDWRTPRRCANFGCAGSLAQNRRVTPEKPLKRLRTPARTPFTQLKLGVNERGACAASAGPANKAETTSITGETMRAAVFTGANISRSWLFANRLQLAAVKNPIPIRDGMENYFISSIWRARLIARFRRRW